MRLGWASMVVAAVLGAAAAAGGSWVVRQTHPRHTNLHDIIHNRFELTAAEHARLEAAEERYDRRRASIEAQIRAANIRLANAIKADPEMSQAATEASNAVAGYAAELQQVTMQHVFEMRAALDPSHRSAYDAVLVDALTKDP